MPESQTIGNLLDRLENAADGDVTTVSDILDEIGQRSTTPLILAISLILVSPLSGIPGVPTISAVILFTLAMQAVLGSDRLWVPRFVRARAVSSDRLARAVAWLRRPSRWIDSVSRPRLLILTVGPLRVFTFVLCALVPLMFPPLELLPMFTSIGALAIALMAFGLLSRDGLFVLAGYGIVGGLVVFVMWIIPG